MEAVRVGSVHGVHRARPAAVSVTQATESGTVYTPAELLALSEAGREHGLRLHMDGARFANAVAGLGCSPAEATWKAGVDVLAFGGSKTGALAAEAVVIFAPELVPGLAERHKRAGQLLSKMRFVSAQWEALLADDLWLETARHANAMARRIAAGLHELPGAAVLFPVQANEVFAMLPAEARARAEAAGFALADWPDLGEGAVRMVTAFDTPDADVTAFLAACAGE